jgi:hypothetical protein
MKAGIPANEKEHPPFDATGFVTGSQRFGTDVQV